MVHSTRFLVGAMALAAIAAFWVGACDSGSDTAPLPAGGSHAGGGGSGGTSAGGNLFGGHDPGIPVSIEISPADPVIVVENGVIPAPTTFTATGITEDGQTVPVSGIWTFDRYDVAAVDSVTGELTVTGFVGGVGTVTFETDDLSATTSATVRIYFSLDPGSVDQATKDAFTAASQPDPSMALLYPYDETVFPRGLTGPTLQWNGGGANDIYYLHIQSPTFELEAWQPVPPPSRFDFPTSPYDIWRILTDSTEGSITMDVQRYDGNQAYLAKTQTWTIAPANLAGTVYYWAISHGDVVRLTMGDSAPESFLQQPTNTTCIACHSVSARGNRIVASVNGGRSPWVSFDAESGAVEYDSRIDPSAVAGNPNYNAPGSGFQAISPEGDYVLWQHWDNNMQTQGYLILSTFDDRTSLATLNPGGGGPSHQTWSNDGNKIAFAVRTEPGGLYFTDSDLWIADVSVNPPGFSNIQRIVDNDANRPTLTYPSFSPGSDWIAFMKGTHAYCDAGHLYSSYGIDHVWGDIWLTDPTGATQIELDNLNGNSHLTAPNNDLNYQPSFLPVTVGGYTWLVFASERNYGNTLEHADGDLLPRRKQLWVAAVDTSPTPGQDPSHPAFWLPGQELATENMRGMWALSPCKELGEVCEAGYECCDGFCRVNDEGVAVCEDQPGPCSPVGDACVTADDCCDVDAECIGGYCATPPPG